MGKFGARTFGESSLWVIDEKEVWQINRSANRLVIVHKYNNLDGISLANLDDSPNLLNLSSPCQAFSVYGS